MVSHLDIRVPELLTRDDSVRVSIVEPSPDIERVAVCNDPDFSPLRDRLTLHRLPLEKLRDRSAQRPDVLVQSSINDRRRRRDTSHRSYRSLVLLSGRCHRRDGRCEHQEEHLVRGALYRIHQKNQLRCDDVEKGPMRIRG